jgi:hypothetical protein
MADQIITLLRRSGIRPETLETYNMQQSTRLDRVLYCRKFYKDSMLFRTIVNRIIDMVNVYGANIVSAPDIVTNEFLVNALREYLLTGEILFYVPTNQLLESERVEYEVDEETGEVTRVMFDGEFEIDYDGIIGEYEYLRPSAVRGEPPFAVVLPWVVQISSLMYAQIRAAEIGSRLLARIVTGVGGINSEDPELQLSEDTYILRTNNPQDAIDFPKYQPADFTVQMKTLLRQVSAACGMPYEVLMSDFTEANFSQSKAAFISARYEINRYRGFIDRFVNRIGNTVIEWPDVESLDFLDQAKAAAIMSNINTVEGA